MKGIVPQDLLLVEGEWVAERSLVVQQLLAIGVARGWNKACIGIGEERRRNCDCWQQVELGLLCEGRWQGVMMTKTTPYVAQVGMNRGRPLLYIDYFEVAPWNWRILRKLAATAS